jgi:hypothetical protein
MSLGYRNVHLFEEDGLELLREQLRLASHAVVYVLERVDGLVSLLDLL